MPASATVESHWDRLPAELQRRILLMSVGREDDPRFLLVEEAEAKLCAGLAELEDRIRRWDGVSNDGVSKMFHWNAWVYLELYNVVYQVNGQCTAKYDGRGTDWCGKKLLSFAQQRARRIGRELLPNGARGQLWLKYMCNVFSALKYTYGMRRYKQDRDGLLRSDFTHHMWAGAVAAELDRRGAARMRG